MPKKGQPQTGRGAKNVPRPHVWLVGPDPYKHSMYMPWQRARAQANFRGEGWRMTFEEFYDLWKDDWYNRGRDGTNVCMTRKDSNRAWSSANCELITRQEHLSRQGLIRSEKRRRQQATKPKYQKVRVEQ